MNGISIEDIIDDTLPDIKDQTKIKYTDNKLIKEMYEFYIEYGA